MKRTTKKQTPKATTKSEVTAPENPGFARVASAFATKPAVTREAKRGFGSGALKVKGKIFAMMSSKGEFVVKLPRARVDELVARGDGERFEPGPGRVMKEWAAVGIGRVDWADLADEAYRFVKGSP